MQRGALLLMMAVLLSGCSDSGAKHWPVSGKVTFQGRPVSAGVIRFSNPQAGIDMTAQIGADGAFRIVTARGPGLPEGTYQVSIRPPLVEVPLGPIQTAAKAPPSSDIPTKYRDPSTSGLTLTVVPGENSFEVDMQP